MLPLDREAGVREDNLHCACTWFFRAKGQLEPDKSWKDVLDSRKTRQEESLGVASVITLSRLHGGAPPAAAVMPRRWAWRAPERPRTPTPAHDQPRGRCRRLGRGSCPHHDLEHRMLQLQRRCAPGLRLTPPPPAADRARPPASSDGCCSGRPLALQCSSPCWLRLRQRWRQLYPRP